LNRLGRNTGGKKKPYKLGKLGFDKTGRTDDGVKREKQHEDTIRAGRKTERGWGVLYFKKSVGSKLSAFGSGKEGVRDLLQFKSREGEGSDNELVSEKKSFSKNLRTGHFEARAVNSGTS